jgi:hypothetical protein
MRVLTVSAFATLCACVSEVQQPTTVEQELTTPTIISAYLGAIDQPVIPFCPGGLPGTVEGMPVVFSVQIYENNDVLDPRAFRVTTTDGRSTTPSCATVSPANEEGEDNTVLLTGDFGTFTRTPGLAISKIEIVGALNAEGGSSTVAGASLTNLFTTNITPVTESVRLVTGRVPALSDSEIGARNGCPSSTVQVVRATWSGGIRVPGGTSDLTKLSVTDSAGLPISFSGVSLAEEQDNDNILDVCLTSATRPATLTVAAGMYTAPNGLANGSTTTAID